MKKRHGKISSTAHKKRSQAEFVVFTKYFAKN